MGRLSSYCFPFEQNSHPNLLVHLQDSGKIPNTEGTFLFPAQSQKFSGYFALEHQIPKVKDILNEMATDLECISN